PKTMEKIRRARQENALKPVTESGNPAVMPPPLVKPMTGPAAVVIVESPAARERNQLEAAYTALIRGQYETAGQLYRDAVQRNPRNASAQLGLASAMHKLNRTAEARDAYEKVLGLDPRNREALSNLLTLTAAESPVAAVERLRELRRGNPDFSPIPAQIANILARQGQTGEAIAEFQQALALAPENTLYRFNLAVLQDRAGMSREAAANYEAVLAAMAGGSVSLPLVPQQIRDRAAFLKSR
ncbi:MAG: tetratricopeptide repeat protein, partial [Rhodospirillales bacterium]|nr:tetratricopeptide repeat protein [Rhodospirillales bacterium]